MQLTDRARPHEAGELAGWLGIAVRGCTEGRELVRVRVIDDVRPGRRRTDAGRNAAVTP